MRVLHQRREDGSHLAELLNDVPPYGLRHLWRFIGEHGLTWEVFAPPHAIPLLEYLRSVPSRRPRQRTTLTVATADANGPGTRLAATTANRILAAVSSC
ncbi:hypothetical protein OOK58_58460 [Streptomyces sp. NBC_01728]|uniref:hypothetical protein n=1 Tax=unclassified Streptomyces TaxID=2593676 RepID=UPI00224FB8FF|nr:MULTISPECIES: hypothetical protein [unclassified Streptomyces]MCX4462291.1 hypothetical protein [Streptomyces sp. NBC_01719]MCX4500729.1 hypothetical protein [Streptomyces sp. NBC_01728]